MQLFTKKKHMNKKWLEEKKKKAGLSCRGRLLFNYSHCWSSCLWKQQTNPLQFSFLLGALAFGEAIRPTPTTVFQM